MKQTLLDKDYINHNVKIRAGAWFKFLYNVFGVCYEDKEYYDRKGWEKNENI